MVKHWNRGQIGYGLSITKVRGKWMVRWVENWLDNWAQTVVISSKKYRWQTFTSGNPQGLILGPIPFITIVHNWGNEIELTPGNVADYEEAAATLQGEASIQRNLDRLLKWTDRTMNSKKGKCHFPPRGWNKPIHQCRPGTD